MNVQTQREPNMRTEVYTQVEAIVAKYKELASNTKWVQEVRNSKDEYFVAEACGILFFNKQLIGHIYQLRAGNNTIPEVIDEYIIHANEENCRYIKGLLNETEEQFLVDHFDVLLDCIFEKVEVGTGGRWVRFAEPTEWGSLVPTLLKKKQGKMFIVSSDKGREFVGLNNWDLTVADGFEHAAVRALACGLEIHKCKIAPIAYEESPTQALSDINDNFFDAVLLDIHTYDKILPVDAYYDAFDRIVKPGGEIFMCISKTAILSPNIESLKNRLRTEKSLQNLIQLPSGNILLHIVKSTHDSFVMCDATELSSVSNATAVMINAFQNYGVAGTRQNNESPLIESCNFDTLDNDLCYLPSYFFRFPKEGIALSTLFDKVTVGIHSKDCSGDEKVVTVNNLSNIFSKGEFTVDDLKQINKDWSRSYYTVNGPAVVLGAFESSIVVGYTTEQRSFLVAGNLYVLTPKDGVDVKYLAGKLISKPVTDQLLILVTEMGLPKNWTRYILTNKQDKQNQQLFLHDLLKQEFAMQEKIVEQQEIGFRNSIHLRKHALSQNISAFDSLFKSLEYCMQEQGGHLNADDKISPISSLTVRDAMAMLHTNLETICDRVNHFTDDRDWGTCESIEPQGFIENYEIQHKSTVFRFEHSWSEYEPNKEPSDWLDDAGNVILREGESFHTMWFPRKALQQVLDNIVSNACAHGFTDMRRSDYVIRTDWFPNGLNLVIRIANNGNPIPEDVNTDMVLEYGYSSALNHSGHGGIGGGEIAEIMRKFNGNVRVISTPNKPYTVTYELTIPQASLY